jgi:hypothetical protein
MLAQRDLAIEGSAIAKALGYSLNRWGAKSIATETSMINAQALTC